VNTVQNNIRREDNDADAQQFERKIPADVRRQRTSSRRGVDRSVEPEVRQRDDSDDHASESDRDESDENRHLPAKSRRSGNGKPNAKERKRMAIKPDKYDGKLPFCSFLAKFESCSLYNDWDEKDKAAHLRNCLTGVAAQLLWDKSGGHELSYCQLKERLQARFGTAGQQEKFTAELRSRRRKPGETLTELYHDIRMLMALAYPASKDDKLSEVIARDHFFECDK